MKLQLTFLLMLLLLFNVSLCRVHPKFVTVIFRHGDRSPLKAYPTDPHRRGSWPKGWGQLTTLGTKEEFHLGSLLRKRYVVDSGFLRREFDSSEVYVRSTDYDRTIMSAQCVFTGLFPRNDNEKFTGCRPIPVHTVTKRQDMLLPSDLTMPNCTAYMRLLLYDALHNPAYREVVALNQEFFAKLKNYTGMIINMSTVTALEDTLLCEHVHNLSRPSWLKPWMMERMKSLTNFLFSMFSNTDAKRRLVGGVWTNHVLNDLVQKSKNNHRLRDRKMIAYSAHDMTVSFMLSTFGLFNGVRPPYSSAFIIELFHHKHYYVKFLYHQETWSNQLVQLEHPLCNDGPEGSCSLKKLQRMLSKYFLTPAEWLRKCHGTTE